MTNKAINIIVVSVLTVYTLVAVSAPLTKYKEILPFFNWSLFSVVPNSKTVKYYVEVSEEDNVDFLNSNYCLVSKVNATTVIANLGRAFSYYKDDPKRETIDDYKQKFEKIKKSTLGDFSLYAEVFNPLEKFRLPHTGLYRE